MNRGIRRWWGLFALLQAGVAMAGPPMMEMFTYQGRLSDAGAPAEGEYDFQFKLFDNFTGGSQVGVTLPKSDVDVNLGMFTVGLDWPIALFDGTDLYLQIEVRPGDSTGAYMPVEPRQFIMGTPYAFLASRADSLKLPFAGSVTSASDAFAVTNMGTGTAGTFEIDNASNNAPAIWADSNGQNETIVARNTGSGGAGAFNIEDPANTSPALQGATAGSGIAVYGQQTGTGRAGYFINQDASNTSYGIEVQHFGLGRAGHFQLQNSANTEPALYAETAGEGGTAIHGYALRSVGGVNYGGYFVANGPGAHGAHGETDNDWSVGVYGKSSGKNGHGVEGFANGDQGRGVHGETMGDDTEGVHGEAYGEDCIGVRGVGASGSVTLNHGGYFTAGGREGRGVYGAATNSGEEVRYGGYFEASGSNGVGAYGTTSGTDGKGLYGAASGYSGIGVHGVASSGTDGLHYGGYFESKGRLGIAASGKATGQNGVGVRGEASSTDNGEKYGGQFTAAGNHAIGVSGTATEYAGGFGTVTYGGRFTSSSSEGIGVYGWSSNCYYSGAGVKGVCGGEGGIGVWGVNSGVSGRAGQFDGSVGISGMLFGNDGEFLGDLEVGGNLVVDGGKFFVQPHPGDPGKQISYVCLEGGEHGVYTRGTGQLDGGRAEIILPEHFTLVAGEEGITVQLTSLGDCRGLFVEEKSPERIVVRECQGGTSDVSFDYLVQGVRRGFEDHEPIQERTSVRPGAEVGPESDGDAVGLSKGEAQHQRLIAKGVPAADGEVSPEAVRRFGWRGGPAAAEAAATSMGGGKE